MNAGRRKVLWLLLVVASLPALGGCAMVTAKSQKSGDYVAAIRGDVLSTGKLSQAGVETLRIGGIEEKPCRADVSACAAQLDVVLAVDVERRLATESELWLAEGIRRAGSHGVDQDQQADAWLEAARYAYAYLFFTERKPGERAFENRQTQVRDYYNYAVQQVVGILFQRWRDSPSGADIAVGQWKLHSDTQGYRLPGGALLPEAVVPADTLRLDGLRSVYRRDGFGAELVAEVSPQELGDPTGTAAPAADGFTPRRPRKSAFSEIPFAPTTLMLEYSGETLAEVLATRQARVMAFDPYRRDEVGVRGQRVPLAANFTAPYGLWLARSGFATQSLRSLLGRERGIDGAHLYLMQPFDPDKRVLLMLHGLASSPEAWVNVANEVLGDHALREHYQIWQVYYPTNLPIALNRSQIHGLVEQALRHFDPQGSSAASRHMVLVGHSMGGVIARLLVSSSGERVWDALTADRKLGGEQRRRVRERLGPLLHFQPLPQVDRAVFIAAPHRGTSMAGSRLGRFIGRLVRLPVTLLENFGEALQDLAGAGGEDGGEGKAQLPNSIDNLRDTDPFVRAVADLPISPAVRYHTIVGRDTGDEVPLVDSNDGVVPYRSAHLEGAESELVVKSWHSVQETPQAILELRRILHAQIAAESASP